tara:strand:+ start:1559 stop:1738 length:180 start_codon:yes stop_codon:yes gene_type:complete
MPKKNIIKAMNNEGHLMKSQMKFQYDIKGIALVSQKVKPKDVFEGYVDKKEDKKKKVKK